MGSAPRFSRDPNTPSRRLAAALAESDEMLRAALVQARLDAGLSQQQLADIMGVSQPTVAGFERYDNYPRLSTLRRYAHAVGVAVEHRVTRDGALVGCGWEAASLSGVSFSVRAGSATPQHAVTADSLVTSFALAA